MRRLLQQARPLSTVNTYIVPRRVSIRNYTSSHSGKFSQHPVTRRECPQCHSKLPTSLLACTNAGCGYIAPLPAELKSNYHALFDFPGMEEGGSSRNAFSVDKSELRKRFLMMQRVIHPDLWTGQGEHAQAIAATQSAELNKAYQTLLSPRLRGEYILSKKGFHVGEADNLEENLELVSEVMEAREELDDAVGEEVGELLEVNKARIEAAIADLENAIGSENWEDAKEAVIRLRYWEGFESAAKGLGSDH